MKARILGAIVLVAMGNVVAVKGQTVSLRLEPEQGMVSRYRADVKFWVVSAMLPQADPSQPIVSQSGVLTQTVTEVSGDLATIRTVLDSSRFSLPPGLGMAAPNLTGLTLFLTVDSRGRVVDSRLDDATVPPTAAGFKDQVGQMLEGLSLNFPVEPLAVGESWTSSVNETVAGPVGPMVSSNEARYTLISVNAERIAVIGVAGTVSQRSDTESGAPVMVALDISGTLTGEFVVDLDSGRLIRLSNSTQLEGEVRMGNSANGTPIVLTSSTEFQLLGN